MPKTVRLGRIGRIFERFLQKKQVPKAPSSFGEPALVFADELSRLGNLLIQEIGSAKAQFAPQIRAALERFEQGRFSDAIDLVRPPLEKGNDLVAGHALLALCFLQETRLEEFMVEQKVLDRLSPQLAGYLRAYYHFPPDFEELLGKNPPPSPISVEMPVLQRGEKDDEVAQIGSFLLLGKAARRIGHHEYAIQLFEEAISQMERAGGESPPLLALAYFEKGYTFIDTRQFDKAREAMERAIALDPTEPRFYTELGFICNKEKKSEAALEYYRKARQYCDPGDRERLSAILRGMGSAYIDLGDLRHAEELFRESVEIDPESSIARNELSYIEGLREESHGALQVAKSEFEEARSSMPDQRNPELANFWKQGLTGLEGGDLEGAEMAFRRSLALDPGNEIAVNALTYLEMLREHRRKFGGP